MRTAQSNGAGSGKAEYEKSAALYCIIAERKRVSFLDATLYAAPAEIDGVHLGLDGHRKLGEKEEGLLVPVAEEKKR